MKENLSQASIETLLNYFDRLIPLTKEEKEPARMIANSEIGIIPNCTHGVFLENFPAVWACVVPFLKQ